MFTFPLLLGDNPSTADWHPEGTLAVHIAPKPCGELGSHTNKPNWSIGLVNPATVRLSVLPGGKTALGLMVTNKSKHGADPLRSVIVFALAQEVGSVFVRFGSGLVRFTGQGVPSY